MTRAKCVVENCPTESYPGNRKMCHAHYMRFIRWGDPRGKYRMQIEGPTEKLARSTAEGPGPMSTPCLLWTEYVNPWGYAVVWDGERSVYAHRFALEQSLGRPLGEDMFALHKCDVKHCVNPEHLYEGTRSENMTDAWDVRLGRRVYE